MRPTHDRAKPMRPERDRDQPRTGGRVTVTGEPLGAAPSVSPQAMTTVAFPQIRHAREETAWPGQTIPVKTPPSNMAHLAHRNIFPQ